MTAVGQTKDRDGSRYYVDPLDSSRVFDSVTTIIGAATGKPWLIDWSARLAAEYAVDHLDLVQNVIAQDGPDGAVDLIKGAAERRRTEARDRGTEVHDIVEFIVLGAPIPTVPDQLRPYLEGLTNFITDHHVDFEMAEATVANSEHMYAGTLDLIAVLGRLGRRLIIDTKTGNLDAGMCPQVAAYSRCDEVWLPFGQRAPMPEHDGAAVLHLRPEYEAGYKLYEADDLPTAYTAFLDMRRVYAWQQQAKARPGPVLYPPRPDGSQPLPLLEDIDGWGRARGVLLRGGFTTLGEVARAGRDALLDTPGFGKAALAATRQMLAAHGLSLTDSQTTEGVA